MNNIGFYLIVVSFLIGSIPFAILVAKICKIQDPRTYGSHNPGTTNIARSGNKLATILTFLGDALKGWIAVYLVYIFMPMNHANTIDLAQIDKIQLMMFREIIIAEVAVFVVLGHIFSVFLKFKGGRGVATAIGVFFALSPLLGMYVLLAWASLLVIFKKVGFASALAALLAIIFAYFTFNSNSPNLVSVIIIALLVIYKHQEYIVNWREYILPLIALFKK